MYPSHMHTLEAFRPDVASSAPVHRRAVRQLLALGACMLGLTLTSACKPPVKPDDPVTSQQPGASSTEASSGTASTSTEPASASGGETKPASEAPPESKPVPDEKPSGTSASTSAAGTEPSSPPGGTSGGTGSVTTQPTAHSEPEDSGTYIPSGNKEEMFARAVEAFEKGPSGFKDAGAGFKAVISSDDKNHQAHFNLGVLYVRQEKLAEAEKEFKKVTELNPKFNGGWTHLADVYRLQKDTGRAMTVVEAGLKELPGDALLLNSKAFILRQQGKTQEAIEEIRKILKVNAIDVNAFNNMGRTYLELKDYDMAQFIFLKALQTAPGAEKDPWIHNNLGLVYLGLKDPRAASEFDRALELKSDLLESLVCRAYLHLTLQEFQKAADLLQKAVELDPESITIRLNYGMALRGLKKYPEAEAQYTTALRMDPKNTSLLLNYGILLGDYVKDPYKAIEVYKQLRDASAAGPELEKAEKLIKETQRIIERLEKKKKDKAAKPEPPPEPKPEGAAPDGSTPPANPDAPKDGAAAPAPAGGN